MNTLFDDFKNAFRRNDNGLIQLILINISIFVIIKVLYVIAALSSSEYIYSSFIKFLAIPAPIRAFIIKPWTIISYFFTHEEFLHIIFNMLFLYWFGMLIKEYLGSRRLINLYIIRGLAGGLAYILMFNLIPYYSRMAPASIMIGASAAVYAIVVAAPTLNPGFTFNLLLLGPVRIIYIAAFYVFMSFTNIVHDNPGGNIAHLGGALIGYIYIVQLRKGRDLGKPINFVIEKISNLLKKKPAIKVTYSNRTKGNTSKPSYSAPNQDEIDAILDKISTSGYESLTKEEKQKLFSASQKN